MIIWLWVGIAYILFQVTILALVFLISRRVDRRYKAKTTEIPDGFISTNEVQIDPVNGKKTRVYYDPETGDRIYVQE